MMESENESAALVGVKRFERLFFVGRLVVLIRRVVFCKTTFYKERPDPMQTFKDGDVKGVAH